MKSVDVVVSNVQRRITTVAEIPSEAFVVTSLTVQGLSSGKIPDQDLNLIGSIPTLKNIWLMTEKKCEITEQ